MRATGVRKEVELCATIITNKTKCMSTSAIKCGRFYIGAHALGFVGYVRTTNFYLLFYPSSAHVRALSQVLSYIFLLSPAELPWSQVIE
jgi:hypothetical protein